MSITVTREVKQVTVTVTREGKEIKLQPIISKSSDSGFDGTVDGGTL